MLTCYDATFMLMMLLISFYFGLSRSCSDDERSAIQEILDSMGYQSESESESALSERYTDDCCQWEGVDCSLTTSRVVRIFFYHIRTGEDLWFPDMTLFARIKTLQELKLVGNHIGGMTNKEALCTLNNLQNLDVSSNSIEDDLPSCLVNMPSLRTINLSKNQFRGDLTMFSNLSDINLIDVSHNDFQGQISLSTFANLSKLTHLDLSYNHMLMVESESPTWHPAFQIRTLFLAGCNLNNRSSNKIPGFLSSQSNLVDLDLSNNLLTGPFPAWMLRNVSSVLRLRGNSFVGQFPLAYHNFRLELSELDISCNLFHGELPSDIGSFLPKLYNLNVSSSGFTGTIPPSLGEVNRLQHLDLSNNHFSGVIPSGLTKHPALWYLNLSNKSLNGKLLPKDCNMTELRWLLLHHNLFEGDLPSCLSRSRSLRMLDIRHTQLSGIISSVMPVFYELGALLLGDNYFSGLIPRQLCQMQKLQFLDLSKNEFSSSFPSCFNNNSFWKHKSQAGSWVPTDFTTKGNSYSFQGIPLTLMTGIDLSANQLIGTIPEHLGELQELHSLNISHNLLTGNIPASFVNLKNLESLDLSYNRLTGQIPPKMARMNCLSTFVVSFNDLSGRIPFDEQISTFPESSYAGNLNLCGEPLQKECSKPDNDNQNDDSKEDNNKADDDRVIDQPLFFYSFVFVSYAIGFWAVVAPLCLCRSWRIKYYRSLDRLSCYCYKAL